MSCSPQLHAKQISVASLTPATKEGYLTKMGGSIKPIIYLYTAELEGEEKEQHFNHGYFTVIVILPPSFSLSTCVTIPKASIWLRNERPIEESEILCLFVLFSSNFIG
jgi:hypothetical protein